MILSRNRNPARSYALESAIRTDRLTTRRERSEARRESGLHASVFTKPNRVRFSGARGGAAGKARRDRTGSLRRGWSASVTIHYHHVHMGTSVLDGSETFTMPGTVPTRNAADRWVIGTVALWHDNRDPAPHNVDVYGVWEGLEVTRYDERVSARSA